MINLIHLSHDTLYAILADASQARDERGFSVHVPAIMVFEALRQAGFSFEPPSPIEVGYPEPKVDRGTGL